MKVLTPLRPLCLINETSILFAPTFRFSSPSFAKRARSDRSGVHEPAEGWAAAARRHSQSARRSAAAQ